MLNTYCKLFVINSDVGKSIQIHCADSASPCLAVVSTTETHPQAFLGSADCRGSICTENVTRSEADLFFRYGGVESHLKRIRNFVTCVYILEYLDQL